MELKYKSLKLTKEEKEAIEAYQGAFYQVVNNLLEPGMKNEEDFDKFGLFSSVNKEIVIRALKVIQDAYSGMYKYKKQNERVKKLGQVARGTTLEDVQRLIKNGKINKFLSASFDRKMAEGYFSLNYEKPAVLDIELNDDVPYIPMEEVKEDYGDDWEKEVVIAPFTEIVEQKERMSVNRRTTRGIVEQRYYQVILKKQELINLPEEESNMLEEEILEEANSISNKMQKYFELIDSINILKEKKIRYYIKLRQRDLVKDDKEFFQEQIPVISGTIEKMIKEKELLEKEIDAWKSKFRKLCKSNCKKREVEVEYEIAKEDEQFEEKEREEKKEQYEKDRKKSIQGLEMIIEEISYSLKELDSLKEINMQNIRMAEEMGIKYNSQEENIELLRKKEETLKFEFENLLKTYSEVDFRIENGVILIQWNEKMLEFLKKPVCFSNESMQETLKKSLLTEINNKFELIKAEIFEKRLKSEAEIINSKKWYQRLIGKFNGENVLDEERKRQMKMIESKIKARIMEIQHGTKSEYNFDVNQLIADLEIFSKENLVSGQSEQQNEIFNLEESIRENFDVDETIVQECIKRKKKNGLLMPIGYKKTAIDDIKQVALDFLQVNGYEEKKHKNVGNRNRKTFFDMMIEKYGNAIKELEETFQIDSKGVSFKKESEDKEKEVLLS